MKVAAFFVEGYSVNKTAVTTGLTRSLWCITFCTLHI